MPTSTAPTFVLNLTLGTALLLLQSQAQGQGQNVDQNNSSSGEMDQLLDMPLMELLDMEVTSVSRREQNLLTAPAAIHVITDEELRRRGVTSIPDALRLVPGVHVASIDGNKWSISARGFSMRFANKLLVQIDGRSVYTPSYSGVYWDMQDLLIADIDRIEVIRGPGATLWGANAVNGIINIITKSSQQTLGGLVEFGVGDQLKDYAAFRYGGALGEDTFGRFYLKSRNYDSNQLLSTGEDAHDDWKATSAGFRLDGASGHNTEWTFQADIFDADENQIISALFQPPPTFVQQQLPDTVDSSGWNLLGRWEHQNNDQSRTILQLYWDHSERNEIYLGQDLDTFDIDFQYQHAPLGDHNLLWGLSYRHVDADYVNSFALGIEPSSQSLELFGAFIQDEIDLRPDELTLTLGSKFEHNDFTGMEVQPSIRLMWLPYSGNTFWGSISRAVRTPSFIEDGGNILSGTFPVTTSIVGNTNVDAEKLTAYELGYRYHGNTRFTLDLALFYNDYDDYQSFEPRSLTEITIENRLAGHSYGLELAGVWQLAPWWQLKASYSHIQIDMEADAGSFDINTPEVINNSSAENLWNIYSAMDLGSGWQLDTWLYYVDEVARPSNSLNNLGVDDYLSLNLRLAWQANPDLELSLVVNNLTDDQHLEYAGELFSAPTEIRRSVQAQVNWKF